MIHIRLLIKWMPWQDLTEKNKEIPPSDSPSAYTFSNTSVLQRQLPERNMEGSFHAPYSSTPPMRMPKTQALALVRSFKKWLVVASVFGFVTFSWLVANHNVGGAAAQGIPAPTPGSVQPAQSTQPSSGGFFHHRHQGGYDFGSGSSSGGGSSQGPATASGVS